MPCGLVFIRGRWVRVGPVAPIAPPEAVELQKTPFWKGLWERLRTWLPFASPEIDWERAVLRLWKREEMGWLLEVRIHPTDPPIYHAITDKEAELWLAGEPTREFIERLLKVEEPAIE